MRRRSSVAEISAGGWLLASELGLNCLGEWAASLAYCRRALEYGSFLDDLRLRIAGLWRTGCAAVQQGDADQGLRYCEEALALARIPFDAAAARMVRGYALIKAGRIEVGIAELKEVIAWFESSRLSHLRLLATLWLAEGHLARGDRASAQPLVEDVLSVTRLQGYVHFEGVAHRPWWGSCQRRAAGCRRACRGRATNSRPHRSKKRFREGLGHKGETSTCRG